MRNNGSADKSRHGRFFRVYEVNLDYLSRFDGIKSGADLSGVWQRNIKRRILNRILTA